MNLKPDLFQQQTMKLAMTQDLSQAIALLQYSSQDLAAFLEEKASENPLISLEFNSYVKGRQRPKKNNVNYTGSKDWLEQIGEQKDSLEDYLFSQVNVNAINANERKILKTLIRNLDGNGYLRITVQDLAEQCKKPEKQIEEVLHKLQQLDPAGVAARDLRECLLLQIKRLNCPAYTLEVIRDFFMPFADKKWKDISKKLDITLNDIQCISDFVQTLQPRPCAGFSAETPAYIVPDVVVELLKNQLIVRMPEDNLAKLKLNNQYYEELKVHRDKQVKQFLQEKHQEYQWILRGIQQRRETIFKVMSIIAEKQSECMRKGFNFLRPMTMREVADELDVHESTVSRTVRDKYVQTPFGTVELRSFFTSGLQSLNNEDVSAMEAKSAIRSIIKEEDKKKPLSDQEIVDLLKNSKSIVLSRRTVAKYREQLKIPSSSKRRRF
ncbi:RNA polymerase factor sigma-54 [Bacillus sp. AGMB 02131]|uniref:RNA polymerase factor sigma-54 n=1 Tax=Peribacillus faecalis TaxID=2772559 RepID=A0A927CZ17_9BACI|nr:RNA polymerase factor sigma-54 [Peribacillus faecalis]MBD3108550.1 RNA polymerase factor sigma-54 [Peribacillus faecalis]